MSYTSRNIIYIDYNIDNLDEIYIRNKILSKLIQKKIEVFKKECDEIRLRTKILINKHDIMLIENEREMGEQEKKLTRIKFKLKEIPYIIVNEDDSLEYEDNFVQIPLTLTVLAILETPDKSETIICSQAVFNDNWVYSYDFNYDELISRDNMKILKKLKGFKIKDDGFPKNLDFNIRKQLQEGINRWDRCIDEHVERGISFIKDIKCILYLNIVGNEV
uniref:Uncharacterized protein n=1 Tax=Mimivirus LCMiAC02 TaxID=2506609 RepID=A0A4D5XF68_9VIRU|nr:MAG: hypothetical protein LCMiAC02_04330 [Mimivirus LCMiAC02]